MKNNRKVPPVNKAAAYPEIYHRKSLWRRIFKPWVLVLFGAITFVALAVFGYYYVVFSSMIDARLRGGEGLIRTTSIYAAPLRVQAGRAVSKQELLNHLNRIGYLDAARASDSNRGRYSVRSNEIEVVPSKAAAEFPHVRIAFSGNSIDRVYSLDERKVIASAYVEPELLTSVSGDKKEKRKIVEFNDLPKHLREAIVAIEDRDFFKHRGINFKALIRALLRNTQEGEIREGGSTITQQLAKNMFLSRERTLKRKLADIYLALILETRLSKEQIFTLYCNEIPLGQQGNYSINGFGEAARVYFGKDVINLSLAESAFLAGIVRGQTYYSPYTRKERALARRNEVLDAMVVTQAITREEAEKAKQVELKVLSKTISSSAEAPYFIDYLETELDEALAGRDPARSSYRIYSTIDMDLQRAADYAIRSQLAALDKLFAKGKKPVPPGTVQAALVAIDPRTGEILAMSGGRDYSASQLNRATTAYRQPGSVFKPIVFATALNTAYDAEEGSPHLITPASHFLDAPTVFTYGHNQTYSPGNFGDKFTNREVSLRYALTHSLNVVTVRIAEKVGYEKVARMADKFGLPRPQPLPALALGTYEATPLQLARAYTTFPNNGHRVEPYGLKRIANRVGETVVHERGLRKTGVVTPQVAWLLTNMMQDVMNQGTAARARQLGFTAVAAGKTGSSFDGWFAGFTPNLVCVVWVGFDDNRQLGLTGSQSALPIWTEFMKRALAARPDLGGNEFPQPEGITEAEIDPISGLLASEQCGPGRREYFIAATAPNTPCSEEAQAQAAGTHASNESEGRTKKDPIKKITKAVENFFGGLFKDDDAEEPRRKRRPRDYQ